jgi:hypothetical protein
VEPPDEATQKGDCSSATAFIGTDRFSSWPMLGYILLKKSQSAWDERDALRILTLTQAAQIGPWALPTLVRAKAAQQEARGLAMTGERRDVVERKLDEAPN